MTISAFEGFRAKLASDGEFKNQLECALSAGGTKQKASLADLVAFAKARGFDFSERDALTTGELSDEQLDVIAAGTGGDPDTFDCSELVQWASGGGAIAIRPLRNVSAMVK